MKLNHFAENEIDFVLEKHYRPDGDSGISNFLEVIGKNMKNCI